MKKEHPPIFSVVMPTYNSEQYVANSIESVLSQTLEDWELLIVDDHSSDNTIEVIQDYEQRDPRIRVFRQPRNEGPAKARNVAIHQATGRYIAFLDSDDLWREVKLERQLDHFERTKAPLIYSAYEKIDQYGQQQGRIVLVPERVNYKQLLNATVIATVTSAYDTVRVGRVLMPEIRKRQDYALWLKILRMGGEARAVMEPLAYLRKRPGSLSNNKISAAIYVWRVYRDIEKLSFLNSLYHFSNYAFRAFIKSRI